MNFEPTEIDNLSNHPAHSGPLIRSSQWYNERQAELETLYYTLCDSVTPVDFTRFVLFLYDNCSVPDQYDLDSDVDY